MLSGKNKEEQNVLETDFCGLGWLLSLTGSTKMNIFFLFFFFWLVKFILSSLSLLT